MVTYSMGEDDLYTLGNRRKQLRNQGDFTLKIEMSTLNDAVSPLIGVQSLNLNAWENFIDNATISADDFNIIEYFGYLAIGIKQKDGNCIESCYRTSKIMDV
jgi:hypothetical protein